MNKRYQVFVSSTYSDLRAERQVVIQALLALDCIPSGMELFPAADDDQWTLIKRIIDDCDYYLVIIAGRYGSLGVDGKSYTQMEYEYAVSIKKPVIAFLHGEPKNILSGNTDPENGEKLGSFRELAKKKVCKSWTTAHDLAAAVVLSMVTLKRDRPAVGWVRADIVLDEGAAREMLRLRTHNEELQQMLQKERVEPPRGSDTLAFGEETVTLHFSFTDQRDSILHENVEVSWSKLFGLLGPLMIDVATDGTLKDKMGEFFRNRKEDQSKPIVYRAWLRDEDFQLVKLQFVALGLIRVVTEQDRLGLPQKVPVARWSLTPYGGTLLNQSMAIRKAT